MILWFIDRFGMPAGYHRTWVQLLSQAGVRPQDVRLQNLHTIMQRTLLQKIGSRKAPTWIPDQAQAITERINSIVGFLKPQAVVLAAPESLACLGIAPEHATLHALRGSVYWRNGIPFLVTLPMSAWSSMVSQKDIGAANYGFESAETLTEGRQGALHQAEERIRSAAGSDSGAKASLAGAAGRPSQGANGATLPPGGTTLGIVHTPRSGLNAVANVGSVSRSPSRTGGNPRNPLGIPSELPDGRPIGPASEMRAENHSGGDYPERGGFEGDNLRFGDGDDDASEIGETVHDGLGDEIDDEPTDAGDVSADSQGPDGDDADPDVFFYEPVLSPVGKFVLTADTMKLARILRDGKEAMGPGEPLRLKW